MVTNLLKILFICVMRFVTIGIIIRDRGIWLSFQQFELVVLCGGFLFLDERIEGHVILSRMLLFGSA